MHDSAHNKATLYCVTKADTPFGPYENEQAVFLWFNEEGDKIGKIEEMFDSAFMHGFLSRFREYMAKKAGEAQVQSLNPQVQAQKV